MLCRGTYCKSLLVLPLAVFLPGADFVEMENLVRFRCIVWFGTEFQKGGIYLELRMQNRTGVRRDSYDRYDKRELTGNYCGSQSRNEESEDSMCREGILPSSAPLANPFVPFQRENPPTYEANDGVIRGTLFPGLDLPYRGMVNRERLSRTLIHELQTLSFAITDLGEYLDTHCNDKEAFRMFRDYVRMYKECRAQYEAMHGPLTLRETAEQDCYNWLKDPWPWDYEANKEG